jgi:hypothetical protein
LRNRFNIEANKKPPTGDPTCPPLVKRAKHVNAAIKKKAGALVLNGSSQESTPELSGGDMPNVAGEDVASAIPRKKKLRGSTAATDERSFLEVFMYAEQQQSKKEARKEDIRMQERHSQSMMWMGTIAAIVSAISGNKVDIPTALMAPPVAASASIGRKDDISVDSSIVSSDMDDSKQGNTKAKKRERFYEHMKRYKKSRKEKKKKRMALGLDGSSSSGSEYEVDARDLYSKDHNKNKKNKNKDKDNETGEI